MSRIGKKPITVPKGVTVKVHAGAVEVQGPKGKLTQAFPDGIKFELSNGELLAKLGSDNPELNKFHGLARSLVANAVTGVTDGFKRELDIVGVGYRAEIKGKQVIFALGYSHAVVFDIPTGIDIAIEKQTHITVTGVDQQLVGQVAANIRRLREPDPYKQKGVRYTGEVLKKKAGKTGAKVIMKIATKDDRRRRIQLRQRKRISGSTERPRLTVFRSVTHIYAQVIDDLTGKTLTAASSVEPAIKGSFAKDVKGGNIKGAEAIGKVIAERTIEKGIKRVVFDRAGFLYHGRIRAVADAARKAGLEF